MGSAQVNWTKPLILSILLFLLGSGAWWLEYKHRPEKEDREEQNKKIFSLKNSPVSQIKITKNGKTTTFRCVDLDSKLCKPGDQSKWEITEPLAMKADEANVNSLLSSLNQLTPTETISLKSEPQAKKEQLLKDYGVSDQNRIEVITAEKSQSTLLKFGELHPLGDQYFAQVASQPDQVLMIAGLFKTNLDKPLSYWRDKRLVAISQHQVISLESSGGKSKYTAIRKDGQWTIEGLAGDLENIDNLLSAVSYLQAKNFVSETKTNVLARSALVGTHVSLTLKLTREIDKKTETIVLTFYEKKLGPKAQQPVLYATVSNASPLYELDYSSKERIDKNVADLRLSKLVTSMDRFTTKKILIQSTSIGKTPISLAHNGTQWMDENKKAEADSEKIQNILDRLTQTRIRNFLIGSQIPAGQDQGVTFSLTNDKGELKRKFVLWKSSERLYARDLLSSRNEAFFMDDFLKDQLPTTADYFQKTAAAVTPPKQDTHK